MSENTLHFKEYDYTMPLPSVEKIRQSIVYKLIFILGVDPKDATSENWLNAAMFAVRDLMTESFLQTRRAHENGQKRMVYYLSMEFLMGRAFTNALVNQNLYNQFKQAFNELGLDLESIAEHEADPGWWFRTFGGVFFGFIGDFAHSCSGLWDSLSIRYVQTRNRGRTTN